MSDGIYVAGLPPDVSEQELAQHFGQIGSIKTDPATGTPCVWLYRDSQSGLATGDAFIQYENEYIAASSVQWFHQKPMRGSIVHVSVASRMEWTGASQSAFGQQDNSSVFVEQTAASNAGHLVATSEMCAQDYYGSSTDPYQSNLTDKAESKDSDPATPSEQSEKGDSSRGRPEKIVAAPQGPSRLFGPDDWSCPSCGNTNWARRPRCNMCGAPKPGTLNMKREGQAGGFKELDEVEIENARRRRKEIEEADDGELYDDYGRIKKKYRNIVDRKTREEAALARLRGDYDPSPSGQELAALFKKGDQEEEGEVKREQVDSNPEKDIVAGKRKESSEKSEKDKRQDLPRSRHRSARERSVSPRRRGSKGRSPREDRKSSYLRRTGGRRDDRRLRR